MEPSQRHSHRYLYTLFTLHFNVPENCTLLVYYTMVRTIGAQSLITYWMFYHDMTWFKNGVTLSFAKNSLVPRDRFDILSVIPRFIFSENQYKIDVQIFRLGDGILLEYNKRETPRTFVKFETRTDPRNLQWGTIQIRNTVFISEREFYCEIGKMMEEFVNL